MRRSRSIVVSSTVVGLLVASLAVPAAAAPAKGKLAIVQGNPAVKVDVCINGREIRSGMRFGARVFRKLTPGTKKLKVAKAAPGPCKGRKLAFKRFDFPAEGDFTIVISKKRPMKVMLFDNTPPPPSGLPEVHRFFRHAADYGPVNFRHEAKELPLTVASTIAFETEWQKGDSTHSNLPIAVGGAPLYSTTWITDAPTLFPPAVVAGPIFAPIGANDRYEWILIGTEKKHRMVLLRRDY